MKKIIVSFLVSLVCFFGYAQTPYPTPNNPFGSKGTMTQAQGGWKIDSTAIMPVYVDTFAANRSKTSLYPGALIRVGDDYYYRSADTSKWLLLAITTSNCAGTQLISGSITWSGSGLVYDATDLDYYILCTRYFANSTTLTLSVADPTFPRIDKFYADNTGTIGVITGTPSANPQEPAINPLTQLDMGFVYIPAGSTVPAGTTQTVIYNENVEWTGTSDVPSVNFAYATNPYIGSVSTYLPNAPNSSYVEWQSNGTDYLFSDAQYLKFWVRLNDNFVSDPLSFLDVTFEYTDVTVSQTLAVGNGDYNMDYDLINQWQLVSIPLTGITTFGTDFNSVHFVINSAPSSFQLDYVYLLETSTVPPAPVGGTWLLNGNSAINDVTQYIGTRDAKKLNFGTNGQIRAYIDTAGIELLDDTTANVMLIDSNGKIWKTYQPTILADSPVIIYKDVYQDRIKVDTTDATPTALATQYDILQKWGINGNEGTIAGTNFIGTLDDVDLVFKRNNLKAGRVNTSYTAFGHRSLDSIVSGINTAYGANSLRGNSTGTFNTAIGTGVMLHNNTGSSNTGLGYSAMNENVGSFNTGIGVRALFSSTGSNNTGIGNAVGWNISTGVKNTAIGDSALLSLGTGSYNTAIGANADVATSSTDSAIAIGYEAVASTKQLALSPYVTEIKATGITGASNSGYVLTTNGSGIATFQAAGGGSSLTGNLTYVDAVNGNDGTAVLGDFTKPFLTLGAAVTAATPGYTIVVRPGSYSNATQLLKDSVDWYFMPNTKVSQTNATGTAMFDDSGGFDAVCKITGYGVFIDTLGGEACVLRAGNSASNIYFEAQSVTVGNGNTNVGILVEGGNVIANIRGTLGSGTISSSTYDAIIVTGGTLNLTADKIISTGTTEGNAIEVTGGTVNIKCMEYRTTGAYDAFGSTSAIAYSGGNATIEGEGVSELADGLVTYGTSAGVLTLRGKLTTSVKTPIVYLSDATNKKVINQATLVSADTYSISAATAQTLVSYGSFANKVTDANITINGILTVGSYVE